MSLAALAALLAASAAAETPEAVVARAVARVDALVAQETSKDARDIEALDRRAGAQFETLSPLGWRAAAPLGAAARDQKRPPKTRLFAVIFLGKLHDPAAFAPLSDVLLDAEQDVDLRAAAAQALAALDVPAAAARGTYCAVAAQSELPRAVLDEALISLARLGCDDGASLERIARAFGPRPSGRDLDAVLRAASALGRSRGAASLRSILALIGYFPAGGEPRAAAIAALARRRDDLIGAPAAEALACAREASRSESGSPASMLRVVELLDALDPTDDALLPMTANADAEVLAAAAEALARRKAVKALPALEAAVAGALNDPRFAPKPGRPDPSLLLSRLETATQALRLARGKER